VPDVTYETALAAVEARLSERSAAHSAAVAQTAARLAHEYGVDVESARLAGLLHDWSREDDDETLLAEAREAGIGVGPVDETVPYLLHARTSASALRETFPGISEDVVQAVSRHTLGAPQMSPLDMVVYVADMIEPSRGFAGVEKLRDLVGSVSLPELFVQAYAHSLTHVIEARKHLHPQAVAAWNAAIDATAAGGEGK